VIGRVPTLVDVAGEEPVKVRMFRQGGLSIPAVQSDAEECGSDSCQDNHETADEPAWKRSRKRDLRCEIRSLAVGRARGEQFEIEIRPAVRGTTCH
jgi:hypothetical protein